MNEDLDALTVSWLALYASESELGDAVWLTSIIADSDASFRQSG